MPLITAGHIHQLCQDTNGRKFLYKYSPHEIKILIYFVPNSQREVDFFLKTKLRFYLEWIVTCSLTFPLQTDLFCFKWLCNFYKVSASEMELFLLQMNYAVLCPCPSWRPWLMMFGDLAPQCPRKCPYCWSWCCRYLTAEGRLVHWLEV